MKKISFFLLLGMMFLSGCQEESATEVKANTQQGLTISEKSENVSYQIKQAVANQLGKRSTEDINDEDFKKVREFTIVTDDPTLDLAIKAMPNLEILNIDVTLKNISFLESLNKLQFLTIVDNQVNIDFYTLSSLKEVSIINSHYENADSLQSLKNLTSLTIINSKLNDITALNELTSLTSLNISKNNITSLEAIQDLNELRTLDVSYNPLEDTNQLKSFEQLKHLELNGTPVNSLGFVESMPHLERLGINQTNVSDVSFLEHTEQLTALDIRDTDVTSILPLIRLPKLSYLFLNKKKVQDWLLLKGKEGITVSENIIAE